MSARGDLDGLSQDGGAFEECSVFLGRHGQARFHGRGIRFIPDLKRDPFDESAEFNSMIQMKKPDQFVRSGAAFLGDPEIHLQVVLTNVQELDVRAYIDLPWTRSFAINPQFARIKGGLATMCEIWNFRRQDRKAIDGSTWFGCLLQLDSPRRAKRQSMRSGFVETGKDELGLDALEPFDLNHFGEAGNAQRKREREDQTGLRVKTFGGTKGKPRTAQHAFKGTHEVVVTDETEVIVFSESDSSLVEGHQHVPRIDDIWACRRFRILLKEEARARKSINGAGADGERAAAISDCGFRIVDSNPPSENRNPKC